ncbi:mycothione reductase [Actinomycetospora sp. NBRC 106375]|uniref:mycothione reductase n=1 Tax=Actinomycetospora sp. NBRC 106375 TaxID=3032207 RepID=UPI0024A5FC20|nr:mycothione reductase [Actinomycetospora sp. NBRC 106375]GLZ48896.1 mycothione reductase [Actinomycetospora sp. NBRC 106375]
MKSYDLICIGAGSGNMLFGPELDGWRSAIVESSRFGGTCLNRGCIPSKMFVVAADAARSVADSRRLGVHATLNRVDWPAIRERVFGRIDPLHDQAVEYRRANGIDVYTEPARFLSPKVLEVAGEKIGAERIVVAAGSRPVVPPIPGLDSVPFHTSDTIMRVDEVPSSMIVVGGGFIAAEMGHVFGAFGARITLVERGPRLLAAEDEQISSRFTELARRHLDVRLHTAVAAVAPSATGVAVTLERDGQVEVVEAAALLVATGRRPNTDLLDVVAGGLEIDEHGHVVTDDAYRTAVPGVWAFGDDANHFQLKHMANAEARIVAHNVAHPDRPRELRHDVVPHAVFADPQIAGAGFTEAQARRNGFEPVVVVRDYGGAAYGWALEDTTSFVKLVLDPERRTLLGAHIMGPSAAILLQPLVQGMMLGQTVDELAHQVLYIHPALTEVVEQALLEA